MQNQTKYKGNECLANCDNSILLLNNVLNKYAKPQDRFVFSLSVIHLRNLDIPFIVLRKMNLTSLVKFDIGINFKTVLHQHADCDSQTYPILEKHNTTLSISILSDWLQH